MVVTILNEMPERYLSTYVCECPSSPADFDCNHHFCVVYVWFECNVFLLIFYFVVTYVGPSPVREEG